MEEETYVPGEMVEEEQEAKSAQPVYPAPFGYKFGNSSVDLSIEDNHTTMKDEYNTWWSMKGDERDKAQEKFNQKYFGMSTDEVRAAKRTNALEANNPLKRLDNTFQGLSAPGLGLADFVMDAAGTIIPGFNKIDEKYDKATMLDNPMHQGVRRVSSIVLPSIIGGNAIQTQLNTRLAGGALFSKPWFTKLAATMGAHGLGDATILGLSDVGEDDTLTDTLVQMFPDTFGPKGKLPLPQLFQTTTSDSPGVRKGKNMLESAPFSIIGSVLGAFLDIKGGHKTMDWMIPQDDAAQAYKQLNINMGGDPDKLIRIAEIDELLSLGNKNLSRGMEQQLINEKIALEESLANIDSMDDYYRRYEYLEDVETQAAIERKTANNYEQLELNINGLDPDLNADVLDDAAKAKQSVPPGNVARNIADTTAIKNGTSKGDPAPIITDSMRRKGLMVGSTSRDAVMGVSEAAREAGRFDAIVDGIRFSAKEMNAAAWGIYTDIIDPNKTVDDIRKLFLIDRDVKNLMLGKFKVEVINEDQARAAAFAMRDLVDRFLGREVTASSGRVMDTLGREAATIAQSITDMAPYIDDNRAMDVVLDKLLFLMDEYALNKYLSGWSLRNKNWFDQMPPRSMEEGIETLLSEFKTAENSIHAKNLKFTKELKRLREVNPDALRPLIDAYAHTKGDVDSLAKLYKWAADQITPLGLLKSPDPKNMNLFAKGAWGVRYNNMLSGISAFRAGVGNGSQLVLRPITAVLGHAIRGDMDNVLKTLYYNGAVWETNRRALTDAFEMMKKVNQDPTAMLSAFRKDYVFKTDKAWDIMEDVAKLYEKDGNWGRAYQLKTAATLTQMSKMKGLRYGMTAMVFPDVFTNTHNAHYYSRVKAYEDVFSEFGYADWEKIFEAEKIHYNNFFDENGLVKDQVLRSFSGEIQLNLDDGIASYLTEATTAYPILKELLAFPRTASNYVKAALSWTPISLIPGINKYAKTIYAKSADDIAAALMEHGIDASREPFADAIFKQIQAEYVGRQAFSSMLTATLWGYAMGGNIRGNGHYNASKRNKERDEMGYVPKTIRIGNNWYSFKGLIGIEHILTLMGDLAYYASDMDEHMLENFMSKATWTIGATFLNESPLTMIEPLFDALNGNERAWAQLGAGQTSWIPASGTLGVLAKAIDSAQKDLAGEVQSFVANRLPGFRNMLPDQIDIWTGNALNDIDNPVLKALNALSPVKVSGTNEPWRVFLRDIRYDGLSMLKMDSTGSYEWKPEDREQINKYIGEQQLFKQVERLMNNKRYQKEIEALRKFRRSKIRRANDRIKLRTELLPIHQELNMIIREAQKLAEARYLSENPNIEQSIINAQLARQEMKVGNVDEAANIQQRDQKTRQLINYGN